MKSFFDRGSLIDQDLLAKIRFSMEADGIKEVEVSSQKRLAFENENKFLYPYLAQAQIGDKKYKFLLLCYRPGECLPYFERLH